MNESVLHTLASISIALAGFSGLVAASELARGAHKWQATELRILWLLIGDSFLVLFFSLLPLPMGLANWSNDTIWAICNALLGSWFIIGNLLALRGERRERTAGQLITVPIITRLLYVIVIIAFMLGIALWLSAFDMIVPRGQAVYVLGLITLLAFGSIEFLFFVSLASQPENGIVQNEDEKK
jgi:hypothetical protein